MGAGCVPSEFNLAHLVLFHFYFIIFLAENKLEGGAIGYEGRKVE